MAQHSGGRGNWLKRAGAAVARRILNATGGSLTLMDEEMGKFFGTPAHTGHAINDQSAMRVSTAFACVRVIAETIGAVTVAVYERQKNGNAEKVDHEVGDLLAGRPNAYMTGLEYREAQGTNLAARGNAFSLVTRTPSGQARNLDPIPWSRVSLKIRESDGELLYSFDDRGKQEAVPQDRAWHWKGFGYTGFTGLSPIECARQALGISLAGEEAQAKLFANGLSSSAIFKIPTWPTKDQLALAEEKLIAMHTGMQHYGKPMLLPGGMDAVEGIFAPRDAQFLELRKMQIPEICRIWRISPHMIADLERATNNNIEQLSLEFVMYTMLPYFRRVEERAQDLFKPADRRKYFVRFNFESLLRADSNARAQLYSILLQNGVYSRNEVRALENRNRVDAEGMDDYTVQSNMALLQLLETINKGNSGAASNAVNFAKGAFQVDLRPGDTTVNVPERSVQVKASDVYLDVPERHVTVENKILPQRDVDQFITNDPQGNIVKVQTRMVDKP
jgi:HK97 family phage portal protein